MWIFLSVVIFILLLITVILLLPVSIILKTDHNGKLKILYKILFKTFGEHPNPKNPIVIFIKKSTGIYRLDKEAFDEEKKSSGLLNTLKSDFLFLAEFIKKVLGFLKKYTIKVLKADIVCATDDAAETAMLYGVCHAAVSPLLAFVHSTMRIDEKGEKINIVADYEGGKSSFKFEAVIKTNVFRALTALINLAKDEKSRNKKAS